MNKPETYGEGVIDVLSREIELEVKIIGVLNSVGLQAYFDDMTIYITGRSLTPTLLNMLTEHWEVVLNDKFYFRKRRQ